MARGDKGHLLMPLSTQRSQVSLPLQVLKVLKLQLFLVLETLEFLRPQGGGRLISAAKVECKFNLNGP